MISDARKKEIEEEERIRGKVRQKLDDEKSAMIKMVTWITMGLMFLIGLIQIFAT